ncbi:hypothetical protein GX50_03517 [[Emmonsia] crescens]|uniref:Uncharacterized protein n=1 Tax=[Emmonsia] crescens TaxID=73230 RepID=A0A2B7ZK37_9EURO|nr:hypothetical protein GX50_03517 [Emmonsia crescens]
MPEAKRRDGESRREWTIYRHVFNDSLLCIERSYQTACGVVVAERAEASHYYFGDQKQQSTNPVQGRQWLLGMLLVPTPQPALSWKQDACLAQIFEIHWPPSDGHQSLQTHSSTRPPTPLPLHGMLFVSRDPCHLRHIPPLKMLQDISPNGILLTRPSTS